MRLITIAAFFAFTACATTQPQAHETPKAQSAEARRLYDEIAQMDARMFEAFNAHDIDRLMALFSEQVEFFHDTGGLAGYNDLRAGFTSNFLKNNGLRRDLVPGSLEVYPISGYGAIEVGAHRFCHQENGRDDCGTFKFVQVWQQKQGEWKVTRVISYGH
jgi:ketosteroid isomerase-like protein